MRHDPLHRPSSPRSARGLPPSLTTPVTAPFRRLRRAVLLRRRGIAVLLAVAAVLASARAAAAPPVKTVPVLVAAADLAAGSEVGATDVTVRRLPEESVPDGTLPSVETVTGRVLAAPVRRGEPLTDLRLLAPALLDGYPGLVAAPVRVADAAVVGLLRVGDRVELVAASPEQGTASVVARRALVVAVPTPTDREAMGTGALVVVAVDPSTALALAEASVTSVLSVVLA